MAIAALVTSSALVVALASAQVTSQDAAAQAASEYNLSVITDTPNVRETEADFKANLTQLDSEFDAALVYWNYSTDTALDQKGPYWITNITGSVNSSNGVLQSGLSPGTSYNYEAYAEPIVWNDTTLENNVAEKMDNREGGSVPGLVPGFLGVEAPVLINQYDRGSDDYIEIVATKNVDVSGYYVSGGQIDVGDVFSGTLIRGEVQGHAESDSSFDSGATSSDDETIKLYDSGGTVIDCVSIGKSGCSPSFQVPSGSNVVYRNVAGDNDDASDWDTASSTFYRNQLNPGQQ